jgi:cytochrome c-type biogenesis protein CcmH
MNLPSELSRVRLMAAVCLGVLTLIAAGDDNTRVDRLGHQMMCVCGACNQYLLECNHVGCAYSSRERQELIAAVNSGKDDSSILQSFIEKYGATVLAAPTKTGFDRVAWVIPYIVLILGVAIVVLAVRAWKIRFAVTSANTSAHSSAELDHFRAQARKETEI